MQPVPVNLLSVLGAAVVMMFFGFLWHGAIFGKLWERLQNFTPEQRTAARKGGMVGKFVLAFVGWLVMSYVLAHALVFASAYTRSSGVAAGMMVGFWNWLGFIAPVTLGVVLWEGKSWKLWALNNGYYAVGLPLMGTLLAIWK